MPLLSRCSPCEDVTRSIKGGQSAGRPGRRAKAQDDPVYPAEGRLLSCDSPFRAKLSLGRLFARLGAIRALCLTEKRGASLVEGARG